MKYSFLLTLIFFLITWLTVAWILDILADEMAEVIGQSRAGHVLVHPED